MNTMQTVTDDYDNIVSDTIAVLARKEKQYWVVNEVAFYDGWVLYISAVVTQLDGVLAVLLGELLKKGVMFKVAASRNIAQAMVRGNLGHENTGKVIVVYPGGNEQAVMLAGRLAMLTEALGATAVPDSLYLGGAVYARYEVVKRNVSTDRLTNKIVPPFERFVPSGWGSVNALLPPGYTFLALLDTSAKNRALKVSYEEGANALRFVKYARRNDLSDERGRDMADRLLWQQKMITMIKCQVPTAEVLDSWQSEEGVGIAFSWLDGDSLHEILHKIYGFRRWTELRTAERMQILDFVLQAITIVKKLHNAGCIHRDIAPGNFINVNGILHIIDFELSANVEELTEGAFRGGTMGFASPQQQALQQPAFTDDMYALGGVMLFALTGYYPYEFDLMHVQRLHRSVQHLIPDKRVVKAIVDCLNAEAAVRPIPEDITVVIEEFLYKVRKRLMTKTVPFTLGVLDTFDVKAVIQHRFLLYTALPRWELLIRGREYHSGDTIYVQEAEEDSIAFYSFKSGRSGIVFLLSGIHTEEEQVQNEWKQEDVVKKLVALAYDDVPLGLYEGKAGMAMALSVLMGANGEGVEEDKMPDIEACFGETAVDWGIAVGIAGQGLAALHCYAILGQGRWGDVAEQFVNVLIGQWEKAQSWNFVEATGFSNGLAGIACFLWQYYALFGGEEVRNAGTDAMERLIALADRKNDHLYWYVNDKTQSIDAWLDTGCCGVALSFIIAYKITKVARYREIAEQALLPWSEFTRSGNFDYLNGLAGMGDVFLEAWWVFNNPAWKETARRIFMDISHVNKYHDGTGGYYWLNTTSTFPAAGLLTGNGGIFHFLIRYTRNSSDMPLLLFPPNSF